MTVGYGTAESRAPSKREILMNNPSEGPHYPTYSHFGTTPFKAGSRLVTSVTTIQSGPSVK
jgi:hypothetical protein